MKTVEEHYILTVHPNIQGIERVGIETVVESTSLAGCDHAIDLTWVEQLPIQSLAGLKSWVEYDPVG